MKGLSTVAKAPGTIKVLSRTTTVHPPEPMPYDIWYVPDYRLSDILTTAFTQRKMVDEAKQEMRRELAAHIAEHGLVNPLIIINHHPSIWWGKRWCMSGGNRLAAVRSLGWDTAPCIVTGECDYPSKIAVDPWKLQDYFRDGRAVYKHKWPCVMDACILAQHEYPDMENLSEAPGSGLA